MSKYKCFLRNYDIQTKMSSQFTNSKDLIQSLLAPFQENLIKTMKALDELKALGKELEKADKKLAKKAKAEAKKMIEPSLIKALQVTEIINQQVKELEELGMC